jgi:uncharacterized phage protein gp47/JayE
MPWYTPTLRETRVLVRDQIQGALPGSDAAVPNSVLRVMSDVQGGLCHLTLQYVDWLALQLLPDTAETVWLDRHGQIWLANADGTIGRKQATLAAGSATFTGTEGTILPESSLLLGANGIAYETLNQITILANAPTPADVRAVDPGAVGNLDAGTVISLGAPPPGVDTTATIVTMTGGTDTETDDELRARVLKRIRNPPMGGDKTDYEQWALAVAGCTRAWCFPNEMGIGTVTLRVMFDDLRATSGGFPQSVDLDAVTAYIDLMRPVTVKDRWILGPIPQKIDFDIANLVPGDDATKANVQASIQQMLFALAAPGQTIFAAWKSYAVMNAPGVISFDLTNTEDDVMPSNGFMAVLGDLYYQ